MSNNPKNNSKQCELCPCRLGINTPSPMAMERIHSLQVDNLQNRKNKQKYYEDDEVGCDFYIISSEHNYCFWEFAKTLTAPMQDREICQLLGINQVQLREDYNRAIRKLKAMRGEPLMDEFLSIIMEKIKSDKNMDIFAVANDSDIPDTNDEENKKRDDEIDIMSDIAAIKAKNNKPLSGQPRHRDGKKVDLYGLSNKNKKRKPSAKKNNNKYKK